MTVGSRGARNHLSCDGVWPAAHSMKSAFRPTERLLALRRGALLLDVRPQALHAEQPDDDGREDRGGDRHRRLRRVAVHEHRDDHDGADAAQKLNREGHAGRW
jgi:hypothetical protein